MRKITSRWPHQNSIKVEWNLGKRCNYDCSYCPDVIHDKTSKHTDIEVLKSTVDKLVSLGKPIRLSFTGGEPTVHPQFCDLLGYSKQKGVSWINVTTNCTKKAKYYLNLPVDHYVFSLHFEYDFHKAASMILEFKESKSKNFLVNIMAHHKYMKDVRRMARVFDFYNIPHAVRRLRWTDGDHNLFDDMRYDGEDLDWIVQYEARTTPNCVIDDDRNKMYHSNDIIKLHMNQYRGWTCNAGIESLMINWDGEVHRATCRVGGSLGNIYQGSFVQPTQPVCCTRDWCTCAADIPLTKLSI